MYHAWHDQPMTDVLPNNFSELEKKMQNGLTKKKRKISLRKGRLQEKRVPQNSLAPDSDDTRRRYPMGICAVSRDYLVGVFFLS